MGDDWRVPGFGWFEWFACGWLALFGMWPFADPGHEDLRDVVVWLDLGLHWLGITGLYFLSPYRLVRVRSDAGSVEP